MSRGGVLEDTFWSPWPGSLQVLENDMSSARGHHFFWFVKNRPWPWSSFHFTLENGRKSRKICENLIFRTPDFSRKFGVFSREDFFFGGRLENFFWGEQFAPCVLGLEGCVLDSTSGNENIRRHRFKIVSGLINWHLTLIQGSRLFGILQDLPFSCTSEGRGRAIPTPTGFHSTETKFLFVAWKM